MALGISFGSNKSKTRSSTDVAKLETGVQSGTTSQNQTTTGSQTSNTTGTQSTTGSQTTSGATSGTSSQTTTGTQQQTQTSQLLSDSILSALEQSSLRALTAAETPQGPQIGELNGFNIGDFVSQGYQAAASQQQAQLEQSVNGLFDSVGGTASGNSMAALLANRLRGDAAANLAGVQANLTAQGNQILRENIGQSVAAQVAQQQFVTQLLAQLRGGVATTTGTGQTTEATRGQTQQINDQRTSQQQDVLTSQQQQVDTTQVLASIINQLINTTTNTVASEDTIGKTKKSGGGFGISL